MEIENGLWGVHFHVSESECKTKHPVQKGENLHSAKMWHKLALVTLLLLKSGAYPVTRKQ